MHLLAPSGSPSVCGMYYRTRSGAALYDPEARMYARNVCCVTPEKHLTLGLPGPSSGPPARRT